MSFSKFIKANVFPIIVMLVVAGIGIYLKVIKKESETEKPNRNHPQNVEYDYTDAEKTTDTLEQFGLIANENFVVRDSAQVRRTPNIARYNTLYELKFGTVVYTKNIDSTQIGQIEIDQSLLDKETRNGFVAVYSQKPLTLSDVPVGYMLREDIIEKSQFKNFKIRGIKSPPLVIPDDIRTVIESQLKIDGIRYQFIQNPDRFNNSLAYGDYNNDGTTDFAIALDRIDAAESLLLVYALHPSKNTYSIISKKVHSPLLKIKTIPKNTKVNVNYEVTSFATDGIHLTTTSLGSFFQVYDANDKTFTVFKN